MESSIDENVPLQMSLILGKISLKIFPIDNNLNHYYFFPVSCKISFAESIAMGEVLRDILLTLAFLFYKLSFKEFRTLQNDHRFYIL